MAKATGQITFADGLPDLYTRIFIDDGQGTGYSQAYFVINNTAATSYTHNPYKSTTNSDNQVNGNASKHVALYRNDSTAGTAAFIYLNFNSDGQDKAFWNDVSTGGSYPAKIVFKDYAGNTVNVTFVNTGSHTDGTAVTGANGSRKISAGNYELNTNGLSSSASTANSEVTTDFLKILEAARDAGEINLHASQLRIQSTYFLQYAADVATSDGHAPLSVMVERASGSWTTANKDFFVSTYGTNTNAGTVQAEISSINEPVYTIYNASDNSNLHTGAGGGAAMAQYFSDILNSMPIQISASYSSGVVSLTNDNHGTDGNVTITAVKWSSGVSSASTNNLTLSGMSGGSAEEGGGGGGGGGGGSEETNDMARTRIGSKLIAVGGVSVSNLATGAVTKNKISSGSVEIGHLNFGEASAAQRASGSLETADLLAVYDKSANAMKAVSLEHLEAFMSASNPTHFTASGDVILGIPGDSDDIAIYNQFISSLIPKTHNANDLGSTTKAWNVVYAQSGSISDNLGVGGTISGSAVQTHTITVDKVVGKDIDGTSGTFTGAVSGSSVTAHSFTGSLATIHDLDVNRLAANDVDGTSATFTGTISGSTVNAQNFSGSIATIHNVDTNRLTANDVDGTSATFSGTVSGSAATFHTITADHLDVQVINSTVRTDTTLEIRDKLIVSALTASSADAAGGGLKIGGSASTFGLAELLWDHSNQALDFNISGTTEMRLQDGALLPQTDNDVDLGSSALKFKNIFAAGTISGSVTAHTVTVDKIVGKDIDGTSGTFTGTVSGSTINAQTFSGSIATIHDLDVNRLAANDVGGTSAAFTGEISGSSVKAHLISGSNGTYNFLDADRIAANQLDVAGAFGAATLSGSTITGHTITGSTATIHNVDTNRLTANDVDGTSATFTGAISGSSVTAHSFTGSLATIHDLDVNRLAANDVDGTSATFTGVVSGSSATFGVVTVGSQLKGEGVVTIDNLGTGSVNTPQLVAESVTKAKLNPDIVRNDSDAHGGLIITSGRLSVGFRQRAFVRADGSNISGSVPTKGMYATDAMPTPYTTASLGNECVSGSAMVYLNGVLLHSSHPGNIGPNEADYRLTTASNDYKILLNEALALDSDDILTVTFFSGSDGTPV